MGSRSTSRGLGPIVAGALTLGACGESPSLASSPVEAGPALCPGGRIVAALADPERTGPRRCVLPSLGSRWRSEPLFEAGSPAVAGLERVVVGELGRYCSYTWAGTGPAPLDQALDVIAASELMRDDAAADCTQGSAQGQLDAGVAAALLSAFRLNTGWVSAEQLGHTQAGRAPVEVAIIDTAPSLDARRPRPRHAHAELVYAVIRDLSCPGASPDCPVEFSAHLGLPRPAADEAPDWERGGRLGSPTDVALAIYEAVEGWARRGRGDRLVINLSLGWAGPARERAPEAALRASLEYAACRGVLVFAAAGNDLDAGLGDEAIGPLLPASLESSPAPGAEQCRVRHRLEPAAIAAAMPGRPLLFAVGGVDERGRALANARPGGRPRLAATAARGLAPDPHGELGEITLPLTGSSIAAAVASGAAALIWSYRPELEADEIVEQLYVSGWDSEVPADFGLGAPGTIHELSVCAALARACADEPGPICPSLECGPVAPAPDGNRARVHAAEQAQRQRRPDTVRVHRLQAPG